MANALKLLLTKPPLMPKQLLMYIPQMCCRRWYCSNRPKIAQKPSKITQKPCKIRRKSPTRVLWRRRRTTMLIKKELQELQRVMMWVEYGCPAHNPTHRTWPRTRPWQPTLLPASPDSLYLDQAAQWTGLPSGSICPQPRRSLFQSYGRDLSRAQRGGMRTAHRATALSPACRQPQTCSHLQRCQLPVFLQPFSEFWVLHFNDSFNGSLPLGNCSDNWIFSSSVPQDQKWPNSCFYFFLSYKNLFQDETWQF